MRSSYAIYKVFEMSGKYKNNLFNLHASPQESLWACSSQINCQLKVVYPNTFTLLLTPCLSKGFVDGFYKLACDAPLSGAEHDLFFNLKTLTFDLACWYKNYFFMRNLDMKFSSNSELK